MAVDRQMEIEDMLASIDEILEQAKSVPFSDKVMVERNEIMEITTKGGRMVAMMATTAPINPASL